MTTAQFEQVVRLGRNTPHQKYYKTDGTQVVGASTPSKIGHDPGSLMGWAARTGPKYYQVLRHAGIVGTLAHFHIQSHMQGWLPDFSEFQNNEIEDAIIPYRKWRTWWEEQELTVVDCEIQLVSEKHSYGGTLDVLARDRDGNLILIDWKSSSGIYDDHRCQVSAYRQLAEEIREEKVFRTVIVRGGKEDDERDFEVQWLEGQVLDRYFQFFQLQLALHYGKHLLK